MRKGEIWTNISNPSIGIRVEEYDRKERFWTIQHVDFKDGKSVYSFIFENASERKITKLYTKKSKMSI